VKSRRGDQTSINNTNEILTVYLKKKRVFAHLVWIYEFRGLEVLVV